MRALRMGIGLSACVFLLAACGGGGGNRSGTDSGSGGGGPITPTANVTVTITSPAINASISQGDPYTSTVSGSWSATNLGNGSVYLQVTDSAGSFTLPAILAAPANGGFSYSLPLATAVPAGERNGTISVRACRDAACNTAYANASGSVAYRLTLAQVGDWQTHGGNAAYNSHVPVQLDPSRFAKAWEWKAPRAAGAIRASIAGMVTGANGVYVRVVDHLGADSALYTFAALEESTGAQRWHKVFEPLYLNAGYPAFASGKIYFGTEFGSRGLVALDTADGSTAFTSAGITPNLEIDAPTPYAGSLYTNSGPNMQLPEVVSVNGSNGSRQWTYGIPPTEQGTLRSSPAVDEQHVYYRNACCLVILDRRNGALVASIPNPSENLTINGIRSTDTFIGSRGNILSHTSIVGRATQSLSSFNLSARSHEWTLTLSKYPSIAIAGGIIYASPMQEGQPLLQALDEATGQFLWAWNPPAAEAQTSIASNIVVTRNLVFLSTVNATTMAGRLWAIDIGTRQPVWSYPAWGSIAISANRTLYLSAPGTGTEDDSLIAIRLH